MDTVFGIQYDGGVVLATDQSNAYSILRNQCNLDKIAQLTSHSAMGVSGPNCDLVAFTEYIAKNLALYELSNHHDPYTMSMNKKKKHKGSVLSTHAQAHFCRRALADALRKGPFNVNVLLGGYDFDDDDTDDDTNNNDAEEDEDTNNDDEEEDESPDKKMKKKSAGTGAGRAHLYWMDYLAALTPVPYGAQGYAAQFCLGLLDRYYHDHLTEAEALQMIEQCIAELHTRFLIAQPNFIIKIVNADGVRVHSFGADPADN